VDVREYIAFYAAVGGMPKSMSNNPGKPGAQGYYVFALPKAIRATSVPRQNAVGAQSAGVKIAY
jgi:hypothetical protein